MNAQGKKAENEIWLWHRRLGHAMFSYLQKLFPWLFKKVDLFVFHCETCELAKSHRASFKPSMHKSSVPFMIIHSDVWSPSPTSSLSGIRWFVTFIDDCTRMTWVCPMKSKSEVSILFQRFHKQISTQYKATIQVLRSDNGGEYMGISYKHTSNFMALFIKLYVPIPLSKMGLQKERTDIC